MAVASWTDRGASIVRALRRNATAIADQALLSVTNFATVIVLAQALEPAEFGAFVLAYTALLAANGIQTGLITQPHNVLGQNRPPNEYVAYTTTSGAMQLLLAGALTAAILIAAGTASAVAPEYDELILALAPAALAWQLQEFVRRVLYTENRVLAALLSDVISYGGRLVLLVMLSVQGSLTGPLGLAVIAVTAGVGAGYGLVKIRRSIGRVVGGRFARENWAFGRWLGASIAAAWLAAQAYLYVTAATIGAAGAGGIRAGQALLGPLNAFLVFLATVLPIRFAAASRGGQEEFGRRVRAAYVTSLPFVVAYGLVIALTATPALEVLYGAKYVEFDSVVMLFALYYAILHASVVVSAALSARRQTYQVFLGNAVAAVLGLVVAWPLVQAWGVEGAVIGMTIGAASLTVVFWRVYRSSSADDELPAGTTARRSAT